MVAFDLSNQLESPVGFSEFLIRNTITIEIGFSETNNKTTSKYPLYVRSFPS